MKYKDLVDYHKKNFSLEDLEKISNNSIENNKEETFNIFQNINMREDISGNYIIEYQIQK